MGRFIEGYDRSQPLLLPACVDDYVPQESLVGSSTPSLKPSISRRLALSALSRPQRGDPVIIQAICCGCISGVT